MERAIKNAITVAFFLLFIAFAFTHTYTSKDIRTTNKYYDEPSYQLAAKEFEKFLNQKTKTLELAREVSFKWSDSIVKGKDERFRKKAEKRLLEILNGKDEDRWRAEAQISLASHFIGRDPYDKQQENRMDG